MHLLFTHAIIVFMISSSADFLKKINNKKSKKNRERIRPIRVSNGLEPNQVRYQHSVGPDLGPKCLQRQKSNWQIKS